jgi:hypothetical protein
LLSSQLNQTETVEHIRNHAQDKPEDAHMELKVDFDATSTPKLLLQEKAKKLAGYFMYASNLNY